MNEGEAVSYTHLDVYKRQFMDTGMMGHTVLWDIMKQREELYAKEDFTDEDGLKVDVYKRQDKFGYNNLQAGALRLWEGTNSYYDQPRLASFMGRFNYTRCV